MKTCSKCGEAKNESAFGKQKRGKNGLRSQCKVCEAAAYNAWATNNKERRRAINARYEAANPDRAAIYRAENPDQCKASTKQWRANNREHFEAKREEWHAANPECRKQSGASYRATRRHEARARTIEWRKQNPERANEQSRIKRARKANAEGSHTLKEWRALVRRYEGYCLCCKKHFGFDRLTLDHVVPLAKGGSDYIANAQPLCQSCNAAKSDHHATDYRETWGQPLTADPNY